MQELSFHTESLAVVVKTRQNGKLRFQPPQIVTIWGGGGGWFFGSKIFVFNFKQIFFQNYRKDLWADVLSCVGV